MTPEEWMRWLTVAAESGWTAAELAERLGVSVRTVERWRTRYGVASTYTPPLPDHGTRARYRATENRPGCSCPPCRAANAAETAAHRAAVRRARTIRRRP